MQFIEKTSKKLTTAILIAALLAAFITCTLSLGFGSARADSADKFEPVSLGLSNAHFTETSGSYPATPSNWTGGYVGNGEGKIVSGVVDLSASVYNTEGDDDKKGNEKYELDQYDEYKGSEIPRTIFGTSAHNGSDTKTLLINTSAGAQTAYAYTSSEMTFAPDSFFRVSAWVKTGDFKSSGATIKLNGLGENCSFVNINTVSDLKDETGKVVLNADNDYGWKKYTIYVRTGAALSHNVTLSLGIGDAFTGGKEDNDTTVPSYASGYAFFDTVTAERISAEDYGFITQNFVRNGKANTYYDNIGRSMAIDLANVDYLTSADGNTVIGTFDSGLTGWTTNVRYNDSDDEGGDYGGAANAFIFGNEDVDVEKDDLGNVKNEYGMTQKAFAPYGKAEETVDVGNDSEYVPFVGATHNILALSTRSGNKFETSCIGVASPDVVIERYKYYRFGVWVKGDSVTGGNGISIGVKGQSNNTGNDNKLHQWYTNLDGDAADAAHYGWKEQVVYIRGSQLSDLTVHFELWLGSPTQKSSGIAYFDNVTFTELSYSEYSEMSGADGGNALTLDAISEDTGINNGNFMSVGDFDELEYPLPVAEWTMINAADSGAKGFSTNKVNTDNVVGGILPVDEATFDAIRDSGKLPGISNPGMFGDGPLYNALVLSSSTKTAVGYRSATFSAAAGSGYKINVDMAVNGVTDGYGASLVLKAGENVISTIENIKNTNNAFRTYTFYVDAPLSDQTLSVEIWLGLGDRKDNTLKLSNGNVYVKRVGLETWTVGDDTTIAQEYGKIAEDYFKAIASPSRLESLNYGIYSFGAPTFDYYDAYTYNMVDGFATPYQWNVSSSNNNVVSGVFDTDNMHDISIYDGFDKKDQSGKMLYIYNTMPNKTTYSYGNSISLAASTYYRLDVTVKVQLTKNADESDSAFEKRIGANIKLTGTKEAVFENIKDTSTVMMQPSGNNPGYTDTETFKTYTFYIASGTSGGSIGLDISLGGDSAFTQIQGKLIVSDVSLTSINNITFEDAKKALDEAKDEDDVKKYTQAVSLSETAADGDTDTDTDTDDSEKPANNDIAWWIIPTVVFSGCLLIAIIIIVAFRIADAVKRKKKKTYKTDYDRNDIIKKLDELSADNADTEEKAPAENLDDYDEPIEETADNVVSSETDNAESDVTETADGTETEIKTAETEEKPAPTENTSSDNSSETDLDD